jgi:hypothetical protein
MKITVIVVAVIIAVGLAVGGYIIAAGERNFG